MANYVNVLCISLPLDTIESLYLSFYIYRYFYPVLFVKKSDKLNTVHTINYVGFRDYCVNITYV